MLEYHEEQSEEQATGFSLAGYFATKSPALFPPVTVGDLLALKPYLYNLQSIIIEDAANDVRHVLSSERRKQQGLVSVLPKNTFDFQRSCC